MTFLLALRVSHTLGMKLVLKKMCVFRPFVDVLTFLFYLLCHEMLSNQPTGYLFLFYDDKFFPEHASTEVKLLSV